VAITAYATGDFALALRELRTYRRISGNDDQLPLMVDSERGVGRPEQALELGRSVERSALPGEVQVALAIAMSGARLDLGQPEAALAELQIPQLDRGRAFSYSPPLFDAYGTVLDELGRADEAAEWFAVADAARSALGLELDPEDIVELEEEELEDDEPDDVPEREDGELEDEELELGAAEDERDAEDEDDEELEAEVPEEGERGGASEAARE
jgi:23S rRNA pseudouridine2605 synthase